MRRPRQDAALHRHDRVASGHVVLRKAATPGFGVELSGGLKSERVRVRAVAFGSPGLRRDASRDGDAVVQ